MSVIVAVATERGLAHREEVVAEVDHHVAAVLVCEIIANGEVLQAVMIEVAKPGHEQAEHHPDWPHPQKR
ncbi:MAG: hypothetical protein U1E76_15780 [Planctomycetota bacterium]